MTDTPSIPPTPPPAPAASGNTPVAPVAPVVEPQLNLSKVPVNQAPAALLKADIPTPVEGRVISSNQQTQEIRIQTAEGEVDVQSAVKLAPDTKVSVELYIDKNQTLANIMIMRQTVAPAPQPEKIIRMPLALPIPSLKEGQMVTALLLPAAPPPQIVEQLEKQVKKPFIAPSPASAPSTPLPIPAMPKEADMPHGATPAPTSSPLSAPDEETHIVMPAIDQKSAPVITAILQKILSAYLPPPWGGKAAIPATQESSEPDKLDDSQLKIVHAQLQAKTTREIIPPTVLPSDNQQKAQETPPLRNQEPVLPLQNAAANERLFALNTFNAHVFEIISEKEAMQAAALPKMYQLTILKIFPKDTPPGQIKAAIQEIKTQKKENAEPQLAEVEAITSNGLPILKTAASHYVIKNAVETPVGSLILFKAVQMTTEQIIAGFQPGKSMPVQAAPDFDPLLSPSWPALHEALQVMQQSDPSAAQVFRHSLPAPTQHLAPTALFFMAALRLGIIDNWIGGNTLKALLDAGRKDLIARLGNDFGKISSQSREQLGDEWRMISIPLLHDEQISQMQFYIRHQHDQNSQGKDGDQKPATRFILNLNLSRMGEMQLDGFIRKKQFDIVLRTENKLGAEMRQELMQRFAQGLEQVQMQGGISFQTREQGWVTVELPSKTGITA